MYHPFAAWDSNLIPSARESRGKGLCRAAERIDFSQGKITNLQWHARHVFDSNQCALVARLFFCWLIQEMQNYLVPGSIDLQAIFFLSFRDQNLCWEKSACKQGVKGHIETNLIKRLNTLTHSLALRKSLLSWLRVLAQASRWSQFVWPSTDFGWLSRRKNQCLLEILPNSRPHLSHCTLLHPSSWIARKCTAKCHPEIRTNFPLLQADPFRCANQGNSNSWSGFQKATIFITRAHNSPCLSMELSCYPSHASNISCERMSASHPSASDPCVLCVFSRFWIPNFVWLFFIVSFLGINRGLVPNLEISFFNGNWTLTIFRGLFYLPLGSLFSVQQNCDAKQPAMDVGDSVFLKATNAFFFIIRWRFAFPLRLALTLGAGAGCECCSKEAFNNAA